MTDRKSNGAPFAILELSKEQYDFLMNNCEANMQMGLNLLPTVTRRETAEALVAQLERFKAIRAALIKAVA